MILEGGFQGTWDDLWTGAGDTGRAGALGPYSRVWAAVTLPDIWGPQFVNQDSDDANKEDEVHLVGGGQGRVVREGRQGVQPPGLMACLLPQGSAIHPSYLSPTSSRFGKVIQELSLTSLRAGPPNLLSLL